MAVSARQRAIIGALERSGEVRVMELAEALGVSDMTVRRDLSRLERLGWLRKVHGGAVLRTAGPDEPWFETKRLLQQPAKRAIAQRALELVQPGQAIGIWAGSTTWMLASLVPQVPGPLSVVTNSTTVADALGAGTTSPDLSVIVTGGLRTPSAALVGAMADHSIAGLHVDRLFLGVHGMDAAAGFTSPNLAEAQTNRTMISHAREVVVLADSTKWGTVGIAGFGALDVADVLITDDGLDDEARHRLAGRVGRLVVVPTETSDITVTAPDPASRTRQAR